LSTVVRAFATDEGTIQRSAAVSRRLEMKTRSCRILMAPRPYRGLRLTSMGALASHCNSIKYAHGSTSMLDLQFTAAAPCPGPCPSIARRGLTNN
jgi:hypothetical protein